MALDEKLGYVMLGYEKAIAALSHLDYKSDTIQILVHLIYQLQCDDVVNNDTPDTRNFFAKKQSEMMLARKNSYINMFGEEDFEYLLNAVICFGKPQKN